MRNSYFFVITCMIFFGVMIFEAAKHKLALPHVFGAAFVSVLISMGVKHLLLSIFNRGSHQ